MRIIGTGKIDDFQKVVLSNKILKSLGVKPGDSLIFSKGRGGSSTIQMFRAEGAHLSNEIDAGPMNENKKQIRYLTIAIVVLSLLLIFLMINVFESDRKYDIGDFTTILPIVEAVLTIALLGICTLLIASIDRDVPEDLITIKSPMAKDRAIGLTKLQTDGHVMSGLIFLYPMFGANPESVSVHIAYLDGTNEPVPIKCIENGPGFSEYKMRVANVNQIEGSLIVKATYAYSDKAIIVDAKYGICFDENDRFRINVSEANISATVCFGKEFQKIKFDENLFDPEDEDIAI